MKHGLRSPFVRTGMPAFTEANRRKVDPNACACRLEDGETVRCPLHAAAPEMAELLDDLRTGMKLANQMPKLVARIEGVLAKAGVL